MEKINQSCRYREVAGNNTFINIKETLRKMLPDDTHISYRTCLGHGYIGACYPAHICMCIFPVCEFCSTYRKAKPKVVARRRDGSYAVDTASDSTLTACCIPSPELQPGSSGPASFPREVKRRKACCMYVKSFFPPSIVTKQRSLKKDPAFDLSGDIQPTNRK